MDCSRNPFAWGSAVVRGKVSVARTVSSAPNAGGASGAGTRLVLKHTLWFCAEVLFTWETFPNCYRRTILLPGIDNGVYHGTPDCSRNQEIELDAKVSHLVEDVENTKTESLPTGGREVLPC